jgi:hypothetical protein
MRSLRTLSFRFAFPIRPDHDELALEPGELFFGAEEFGRGAEGFVRIGRGEVEADGAAKGQDACGVEPALARVLCAEVLDHPFEPPPLPFPLAKGAGVK